MSIYSEASGFAEETIAAARNFTAFGIQPVLLERYLVMLD